MMTERMVELRTRLLNYRQGYKQHCIAQSYFLSVYIPSEMSTALKFGTRTYKYNL